MTAQERKTNFIQRAIEIHGNKYDYSKVEYINSDSKICIICSIHGEYYQTPRAHLKGHGCTKCYHNRQKSNKDKFIEKANIVHGDTYDYSKVEYIGSNNKVCIICPQHGEYYQKPSSHLFGKGCSICGGSQQLTTEEFIKKVKIIHDNKYDYSKVEYTDTKSKVCIICKIHGEFYQRPNNHISGQGCPKCGNNLTKFKTSSNTKEFIEKARLVHGDKYDYSKVEYINSITKICLICPQHGEFFQKPSGHLSGKGCPKCNESTLERKIEMFLINNDIEFQYQKKFKWLGRQSLDFYIPKYNIGIECQGEQHFKSVDYFGGENGFELQQERDERKKLLCQEHNVNLIYFRKNDVIKI